MKKGILMSWVKAMAIAYLLSAVMLLILSFLMYQWDISEGIVRGGILFIYVLSCFVGGAVLSRGYEAKRYLWGLAAGVLYFLILWIVSMAGNRQILTGFPGILSTMCLCVLGGMLGGMSQAGK